MTAAIKNLHSTMFLLILVEAKYEVHKADYGGEDVVEVNGRRYFVLKTYDTGTDTIELTLTDLRHRNEA